MATFARNNFPWPTGALLEARLFDVNGATVANAPLSELLPALYSFATAYSDSALGPLTYEIRAVTTQSGAGFDTGTNAFGPAGYGSAVASPSPEQTIGITTAYGSDLQPASGVRFRFQQLATDGTDALSFPGEYEYATSGVAGAVSKPLWQGAKYWAWRETSVTGVWGPPVEFVADADSQTALPPILGKPV